MTYFKDNPEIDAILENAHVTAEGLNQKLVTVDHVFYALIKHKTMYGVLKAYGCQIDEMITEVYSYLEKQQLDYESQVNPTSELQITPGVDRIMKQAIAQLIFLGRNSLQPFDLFLSISAEKHAYASYFINKYGINDIAALVAFIKANPSLVTEPQNQEQANEVLNEHCTNLNELAKNGQIDVLIGREKELQEIVNTLAKRNKSNILMVGEAGVGKTALAEGLALNIVQGKVPDYLKDWTVWGLDVSSIVAGSRFRGDFEEKLSQIIEALTNAGKCILFIDEAHQIKGAGAGGASGNSVDFANMIKPAISKGKIKVIASTTWEEYTSSFDKDRALMRRFYRLSVDEPTPEQAKLILQGSKNQFEKFHGGTITNDAVAAAVDLSVRFQADKKLPDKAIDLIDSASAKAKVAHNGKAFTIDRHQIMQEISTITGIPVDALDSQEQKTNLMTLDSDIKLKLYDQDAAVDAVVNRILVARAGLKDPLRPIGSFLFLGPTGVGKTALAMLLAEKLHMGLLRFDMSEYSEPHTVARLIGAPPGYVGHGQGATGDGLLISGLDKNPNSVILIDEVEKANVTVIQILLQMMSDGIITGGTGKTADCKNAILIMTSNLGAEAAQEGKSFVGFGDKPDRDYHSEAVKSHFKPEFSGRLTDTCVFKKLSEIGFRKIVAKFINQVNDNLVESNLKIHLSEEVVDYIISEGKKENLGARPIANIIDRVIKLPLSKTILFSGIEPGSTIDVVMKDKVIAFEPRPSAKKKAMKKASKKSVEPVTETK